MYNTPSTRPKLGTLSDPDASPDASPTGSSPESPATSQPDTLMQIPEASKPGFSGFLHKGVLNFFEFFICEGILAEKSNGFAYLGTNF